MRIVFLSCLFVILSGLSGIAQCVGTDQRTGLNAQERAELDARLQDTPFATGNHWSATRGDTRLHVIGTVHIGDPRLAPVLDRLAPLLDRADRLWVEATKAEETKLQEAVTTRPDLLFLTTGPTLPDLMPDAEWQNLAAEAQKRGIPGFMAAKFQPWYLSALLSVPACAMPQIQAGAFGLDKMLMEQAAERAIPMTALEPYDTLFALMGTETLEQQIAYLQLGVLPNSVAENSLITLMGSYFEENTAEIMEVARQIAFRHVDLPADEVGTLFDDMLDKLLVARNRAWMDTLDAAPNGLTVVAVGAGHLPGRDGLLNLLEQAGFTLQREPF